MPVIGDPLSLMLGPVEGATSRPVSFTSSAALGKGMIIGIYSLFFGHCLSEEIAITNLLFS
jgi:hypothetical protein